MMIFVPLPIDYFTPCTYIIIIIDLIRHTTTGAADMYVHVG